MQGDLHMRLGDVDVSSVQDVLDGPQPSQASAASTAPSSIAKPIVLSDDEAILQGGALSTMNVLSLPDLLLRPSLEASLISRTTAPYCPCEREGFVPSPAL